MQVWHNFIDQDPYSYHCWLWASWRGYQFELDGHNGNNCFGPVGVLIILVCTDLIFHLPSTVKTLMIILSPAFLLYIYDRCFLKKGHIYKQYNKTIVKSGAFYLSNGETSFTEVHSVFPKVLASLHSFLLSMLVHINAERNDFPITWLYVLHYCWNNYLKTSDL